MDTPLARVGLISDIHGAHHNLREAVRAMWRMRVTDILCAGDVIGQGDIDGCLDFLHYERIPTVRGNHDRWFLQGKALYHTFSALTTALSIESRLFLEEMRGTLQFETVRGPLLLCHGIGGNDMAGLTPEAEGYALDTNEEVTRIVREGKYRYVLCGHTHKRMVRCVGKSTFVNPGSLGDADAGFAVIDFERENVLFFRVDRQCGQFVELAEIALSTSCWPQSSDGFIQTSHS